MELDQTQKTHPAPQWLPIGALRKDSTWPFWHLSENQSQGLGHQTTVFSAILHGTLDIADDARTLLHMVTFYCMNFEKTRSKFASTISVVASALIMQPNTRGLHNLACLMMFDVRTKFQHCSNLVGWAPRMNSQVMKVTCCLSLLWQCQLRCPVLRCYLLQPSLAVKNMAAKPNILFWWLTAKRENLQLIFC